MRWYQHRVQGVINITSPMKSAPAVDKNASNQAVKSSGHADFMGIRQ